MYIPLLTASMRKVMTSFAILLWLESELVQDVSIVMFIEFFLCNLPNLH